jgi:hypothetical protein
MSIFKRALLSSFIAGLFVSQIYAEPDPNFHIFLLFGQSNMAGPCNNQNATAQAKDPKPEDCDTTSRVRVLAWGDCNANSYPCPDLKLNRTYDRWYTAFPPYHNCHEGIGPADYFGKTLLDSIRHDIKIGFVPCALSGQNIAVFMKGSNAAIDNHTQPVNGATRISKGGYEWMVKRAKIAQESGVIKGILLHQGEANSGEGDQWVSKVKTIVNDLKNDLKLGDIPFIAGELIQDPAADQNAKRLNPFVNKLPSQIPHCGVASSQGFKVRPGDTYRLHFDCAGVREFGRRYAMEFLKLADTNLVPRRIDTTRVVYPIKEKHQNLMNSTEGMVRIYTLDGHLLHTFNKTTTRDAMRFVKAKGVFIVSRKLENGKDIITPFVRE